ncbi:MAG: hypothetical protein C0446_08435 [Chitinophaga sp.]|nr:hypothetical protein [Chitinophaga sp.]
MSQVFLLKEVEVLFGQLAEAQSFKGQEGTSSFSVSVRLSPEQEAEFVAMVKPTFDTMKKAEMDRLKALGKNSKITEGTVVKEYKGEPRLTFKRKEKDGAPAVLGGDNKEADPKTVRRGALVDISFEMRPYVVHDVFNVTLVPKAVRVRGSKTITVADAAALFGDPIVKVDTKEDSELF